MLKKFLQTYAVIFASVTIIVACLSPAQSAEYPHSGQFAAQITINSGVATDVRFDREPVAMQVPVVPGHLLHLSLWVKNARAVPSVISVVTIGAFNSSTTPTVFLGQVDFFADNYAPSSWTQFQGDYTVPAGATGVSINIRPGYGGHSLVIDDVSLTDVTAGGTELVTNGGLENWPGLALSVPSDWRFVGGASDEIRRIMQSVWNGNPNENNIVCSSPGHQTEPAITTDEPGGAIVAWTDARNGGTDIYAQRIGAEGAMLWASNGVPVCTAAGVQGACAVASDGAGGAIIVWEDQRSGISKDIFAQRLNASGVAQWPANGVQICGALGDQTLPKVVGDGSGRSYVVWLDARFSGGTLPTRIYAQYSSPNGIGQWTADGILLSAATSIGTQSVSVGSLAVSENNQAGALAAWVYDDGSNPLVRAQKLTSSGVSWGSGYNVCGLNSPQTAPSITDDRAGGAIVAWQDLRNSATTSNDIYAQRILSTGAFNWGTNGKSIDASPQPQANPNVRSLANGSAVITWVDYNNGGSIRAQRVNIANGGTTWYGTVRVGNWGTKPVVVSDGGTGAIILWNTNAIVAQRLSSNGVTMWMNGGDHGILLCKAQGNQCVADGSGGIIGVWSLNRSGSDSDIFASRVDYDGTLPVRLTRYSVE